VIAEPVELPDHEERMAAARARALWELGDPSWAAVIVRAYLRPDEDRRLLAEEKAR
jgi:hypothetical protein